MRLATRILRQPQGLSSRVFSPLANIAVCRAPFASSASDGSIPRGRVRGAHFSAVDTTPGARQPGDWICPSCKRNNFKRNLQCFKCQAPRASGGNDSFRAFVRRDSAMVREIPWMNDCKDVPAVLDAFDAFGHRMKPNDLKAVWNRIDKLTTSRNGVLWLRRNPEALRPLLERTQRDVGQLSARSLANATRRIARIGSKRGWQPGRQVWMGLAEAAEPRLAEFTAPELSNLAWAFATAGHQAPTLFDALAVESSQRLAEFDAQDLSNLARAFATAGHQVPTLFDALAEAAPQQLVAFTPQALANTSVSIKATAPSKLGSLINRCLDNRKSGKSKE